MLPEFSHVRRNFLTSAASGLGSVALASLLSEDRLTNRARANDSEPGLAAGDLLSHFAPRHDRLKAQVESAIGALDQLIAKG